MSEEFPSTAEEFYRRRDHRTNAYREVDRRYSERIVQVTADSACLTSVAGQVLLLVTCNLLARWCRRVAVTVSDRALVSRAISIMEDADPFGQFTAVLSGRPDLHAHIGDAPPHVDGRTTVVTSAGWLAGVGRAHATGKLRMQPSANPIGAACAAILGGAQVFRDALDRGELFPAGFVFDGFTAAPSSADAISHHAIPADLDIGRALVTGSGSVCSAALYFADLFGVRAELDLVDADLTKIENFGRSPFFGQKMFGLAKVHGLAGALANSTLRVTPTPAWWHEARLSPRLDGYDVLLPLANEHGIRWELQNLVPPLMIHASTGRNWSVNFGRHVPRRDDCLVDRFEGLNERPVFKCSEGQIQSADKTIDAALPFLSFFAGLLIAIDLVRLSMAGYPHTPNFGEYRFGGRRFGPQLLDLGPRPGCICTLQHDLFWRMRGDTRHARFSAVERH